MTSQVPQELRERYEQVGPWRLRLISYRLGDTYYCTADNVDPGAILVRSKGLSREEAEAKALQEAKEKLLKTKILQ